MSVMKFMLMLVAVVMRVLMLTVMATVIVVVWRIQMLFTHMKPIFVRLKTTVKKKKTDLTSPGDGIDWVTNILETKPATSVSKLLGVTPLVNTLDKARKALHKKENCQKRYCQNKYKDTLASVQTQVLAATKSTQRK